MVCTRKRSYVPRKLTRLLNELCVCMVKPCRCEMTEGHTLQKPRKPINRKKNTHTKTNQKMQSQEPQDIYFPTPKSPCQRLNFCWSTYIASQDKNMDELGELLKLLGEFPLVFFRRVDSRSTIQISILPGSGMV